MKTNSLRCLAGAAFFVGVSVVATPSELSADDKKPTAEERAQERERSFEERKRKLEESLRQVLIDEIRKREGEAGVRFFLRGEDIERELKTLKNHDWAGSYFQGDGLGKRWVLSLAPKSGATVVWMGCLGLYGKNWGDVKVDGRCIHIKWAPPAKDELFDQADEFLIIRWGERRYLVPPEEILDFCGTVENGDELGRGLHGLYYLRIGDEKKKAEGKPDLPKGFEKYLSMPPIQASVTAAGPINELPTEGKTTCVIQTVTINAGEAQGVLSKMEFEVIEPKRTYMTVKVTSVKQNESEAVATSYYNPKTESARPAKVGWKMSTGHKWRT